MGRYGTSRRGGGWRDTVLGLLLGGVAIAVIGGAGVWCFAFGGCGDDGTGSDLCPLSGPLGYAAIVIDTTDRIGPRAQREVERVLSAAVNGLERGTKLGLYLVVDQTEANPDGAERKVALCRPPSAEEANIWLESVTDAGEIFQREFVAPVQAALTSMLDVEAADSSPIVEAVQLAATDLLPFDGGEVPQKVIIVSDMIQNSRRFSFFRGDALDGLAAETRSALGIPLDGVEVQIVRILRPGFWEAGRPFDRDEVNAFWRSLLDAGGAVSAETVSTIAAE